ncbi:MAG: SRPBCC family protein [Dermatophilaceae bacterium]|nr:SRPBCC family protein [Actinomycetales bacterium]
MTNLLRASRTVALKPTSAFDAVLPMPLPELFCHWYGPIPPVRSTNERSTWGEVGQQRLVDLVGPGSMRETLILVDRPREFAYQLGEIRGPMAALIVGVTGRWMFAPEGTGTRITWEWEVTPRSGAAAAMPIFGWLWRGYAVRALRELASSLAA